VIPSSADVTVQGQHDLGDVHEPDRQLQGDEIWTANVATGSIRARRVGRDRSFAARHGGWPCDWPLCRCSPTFKVAPAAEVKVGLMAVGVSTPDGLDRLLTLQC
jgi:hypothetical protein